jgi:hypothetical protein
VTEAISVPFSVILREPFAFVILRKRSDRRIWLRINSATEEPRREEYDEILPLHFVQGQDDRGVLEGRSPSR